MEENKIERKALFMTISIHRLLATKLKALGKGSYSRTISYLLGNKVDDKIKIQLDEHEERLDKIEELITKISNKIRVY
jgi:hypothetical protein